MDETCINVEQTKMIITIGIWKWKIVTKNLAVNQIKKVVFLSIADNTIIKDDPIQDFHVTVCLCVLHMTLWNVSTDNTSVNWIINIIKILFTK
jgi:hypothetical protein